MSQTIEFISKKLSECTTLGLGGETDYFFSFQSVESLITALKIGVETKREILILGGGSNLVVPDKKFHGIVLQNKLGGINYFEKKNKVYLEVGAGVVWDDFVTFCIERNFVGVECLSGIPGSVGATPIQNVGAYGQEVAQVIQSVDCLNRNTFTVQNFTKRECKFSYRNSIFKETLKNQFVILKVCFVLKKKSQVKIHYQELEKKIKQEKEYSKNLSLHEQLQFIRSVVLDLRKKKSMLVDPKDIHSRSAGSFFINPILNYSQVQYLKIQAKKLGVDRELPIYPFFTFNMTSLSYKYKVSAAWLIEAAGFSKGYKKGGIGISKNHALALVNYNGSTSQLLSLAKEIQSKVYETFHIHLNFEPVIL